MEKQTNLSTLFLIVAALTASILMIPLIAMQFTNEVKWGPFDFAIMGALIFGVGTAFVLLTRYASSFVYRAAVAVAIGTTFLLVWANMAVGLIGSGPNIANMMYIGIVAVVIVGTYLSKFTAIGFERTMFVTSLTLILFAAIQIFTGMHEYVSSSVVEVIAVNSFFAGLYAFAGLLFRYVALQESPKQGQA